MRRWRFYILFAVAMMMVGCQASDLIEDDPVAPVVEEANTETEEEYAARWAKRHAEMRKSYVENLYRSWGVGYGYDATGQYANYADVRDRIIDLNALKAYDEKNNLCTIVDDRAPCAFQHLLEGKDSETLLKSLSANAGLNADVGFFQAEVKVGYASSDLKSNYYAFCSIQDGITLASRHLEPYNLAQIARKDTTVLSQGFRRYVELAKTYLNKNDLLGAKRVINDMFQTYGTHMIYKADLGGMLNFTTTVERLSLDSEKELSAAAKFDFLSMCGESMEHKESSSFKQTSTQRKSRITARGGDVTIVTKMLSLNDELENNERRDLCNQWYASLKIDLNDESNSNVELVGMKLIPVADLIYDETVMLYYNQLVGETVEKENEAFPRSYNKSYCRIPVEKLSMASETEQLTVTENNEIIGEIDNETINGKTLEVFYPTLEGVVHHEGIGRNLTTDSLYIVTWNYKSAQEQSTATLHPIGIRRQLPYIYYNNGDVDVSPEDDRSYSDAISIDTLSIFMWDANYRSTFKCGPYTLATGCFATTQSGNLNNYVALSQDVPFGYEIVSQEELLTILHYVALHTYYLPDFFRQQWIMPTKKGGKTVTVVTPSNQNNFSTATELTTIKNEDMGFIMLKRTNSFRYP